MMGPSGYSSEVERQLPKLNVASSILATRSNIFLTREIAAAVQVTVCDVRPRRGPEQSRKRPPG